MTAPVPLVWSDAHRRHVPSAEIWLGLRTPAVELPARADAIRAELEGAGHAVVAATPHSDDALLAVHDRALVDFLAGAWDAWQAAGLPDDPGQPEVIPYLVLAGAPAAYACCRPPGHHVTRDAYGGCCYLNNAAIAAARLRDALGDPVALIDVDAHHGNGAQAIFYDRADVLTGSVHVDPGAGWFPHFLGFAGEEGEGGANRNLPLAPGSDDGAWVAAVRELTWWAAASEPRALVVALGVDAAAEDAESPLRATRDGFRAAGHALGALGLPTVVVQEGGYDIAAIGGLVRAALEGLASGHEEGTDG